MLEGDLAEVPKLRPLEDELVFLPALEDNLLLLRRFRLTTSRTVCFHIIRNLETMQD